MPQYSITNARNSSGHVWHCGCLGCAGGAAAGAGTPTPQNNANSVWSLSAIVSNLNRSRTRWGSSRTGTTVSFSFMDRLSADYNNKNERSGYSRFTAAQRTAARNALAAWSRVANIRFVESRSNFGRNAQIRFANTTTGPGHAWAYFPGAGVGGDIWINPSSRSNHPPGSGYGRLTLVHEIGHSIGLSHPGTYNGSNAGGGRAYAQDSRQYTAMSYFGHDDDSRLHAAGPLLHDIAAAQAIYGANMSTARGNNVYRWSTTSASIQAIWDAGGTDTINAAGHRYWARIDLRDGQFSSIGRNTSGGRALNNIAIAHNARIERAVGTSHNDVLIGNQYNNILYGGAGTDRYYFIGRFGSDRVIDGDRRGELHFVGSNNTVRIRRSGVDAILTVSGSSSGSVRVTGYYNSGASFRIVRNASIPGAGTTTTTTTTTVTDDYAPGRGSRIGTISATGSQTGRIDYSRDVDRFRVYLRAGRTYQFDLEGSPTRAGSLSDAYLRLRNSSGRQLAANDDGGTGRNARIRYRAASTGYYHLDASGYGTRTGTYRLTSREDQHTSTKTGSTLLPSNGFRTGRVDFIGDVDRFRVYLTAGRTYQFDMEGSPTRRGDLSDAYLRLRDRNGRQLTANDDGGVGTNARIRLRAGRSGYYYLDASGYSTRIGSYRLTSREDDYAASDSGIGYMSASSSRTGRINYSRDVDRFRVYLRAGRTYQFDMEGSPTRRGTLSDPLLRLRNSSGRQLAVNDDGGTGLNSRIRYRVASSGYYFLDAGAYSTRTGTYRLTSRQVANSLPQAGRESRAAAYRPPNLRAIQASQPLQGASLTTSRTILQNERRGTLA